MKSELEDQIDIKCKEMKKYRESRRLDRELHRRLSAEILDLERRVADENGIEYADEYGAIGDDWGLSNYFFVIGDKVSCVVVVQMKSSHFALIVFRRCVAMKRENVNDEVVIGHPLNGKGLDIWMAFEIKNSSWIDEIRSINSVHPQYKPQYWGKMRHYLLFFKDRSFEVMSPQEPVLIDTQSTDEGVAISLAMKQLKMRV